jgi:hypothetical protein
MQTHTIPGRGKIPCCATIIWGWVELKIVAASVSNNERLWLVVRLVLHQL